MSLLSCLSISTCREERRLLPRIMFNFISKAKRQEEKMETERKRGMRGFLREKEE